MSNIDTFLNDYYEPGKLVIDILRVYEHYVEWAGKNNKPTLERPKFLKYFGFDRTDNKRLVRVPLRASYINCLPNINIKVKGTPELFPFVNEKDENVLMITKNY